VPSPDTTALLGDPLEVVYQSFGQKIGMERYQSHLESLLATSVGPHTRLRVSRLESALIEGKGFSSTQALDLPALLKSILDAVDRGADAIAIGNGFDPGLWEARELVDVPVLGLFYGLRLGWRLGVLCSGTSGPARVEELAARYGIATRLVRPCAVDVSVPMVMEAFEKADMRRSVIEASRQAIGALAAQGAEVVMIASGALDVLLQAEAAGVTWELPLLPATRILACELEAAAALSRLGVPSVSRVGRFRSPPASIHAAARMPHEP
jgi:Asp/Glu/hydantoin racemase